jgi:hypothetical protein
LGQGSPNLPNSTGERNLVNSWSKNWVIFILGRSKQFFESFERIEYGFDILFGKNFGYVISSSLDVEERKERWGVEEEETFDLGLWAERKYLLI